MRAGCSGASGSPIRPASRCAATLRALWSEAELPEAAFPALDDPALVRRVLADHEEAQSFGATGVPAVRLADQDFVLVGAQPEAVYLRWLSKVAGVIALAMTPLPASSLPSDLVKPITPALVAE